MNFLRIIYRKILAFVDSPVKLVGLFTIVMLIPNIALTYTEPYSFSTITASFLLAGGFYLLWVVAAPRPGLMYLLALPLMVLGAFQLVITYLFGNSIIAVDMFTNVFTTNVSEAGELLGNIFPSVILVCIIYIPLLIIGIRSLVKKGRLTRSQRAGGAIAALLMLVIGGGFAGISNYRNSDFAIKYHIFPVNVAYNIKVAAQRWHRSMDYPKTSKGFLYRATREHDSTRREVYIFVIGEASRACSWSLYGYDKETNPTLAKQSNLTLFSDVLTQSNTTHKSVPIMLSSASAENFDNIYREKSMVTLFMETGVRTAFISNQSSNRSLIDYFAAEADTLIDVTPHRTGLRGMMTVDYKYDSEVIPHVRNLIDETDEDLFIIIHTYGSHTTAFKRYPREFAHFMPDETGSVNRSTRDRVVNAYDNSVRYTDHVLSELIGVLDSLDVCSALLYCSDHGEDLLDDARNRFLHASPTTTYYQLHVPAFAWFSDGYIGEFPQKYAAAQANKSAAGSTSSLFHTIADIASIESSYVDRGNSLVSDQWEDRPRMYINDYDKAVGILSTGLSDSDVDLLEKHNKINRKDYTKVRY